MNLRRPRNFFAQTSIMVEVANSADVHPAVVTQSLVDAAAEALQFAQRQRPIFQNAVKAFQPGAKSSAMNPLSFLEIDISSFCTHEPCQVRQVRSVKPFKVCRGQYRWSTGTPLNPLSSKTFGLRFRISKQPNGSATLHKIYVESSPCSRPSKNMRR
jgi:hypothetical protein